MHCQMCMAMRLSAISEREIMLMKEEKLSQSECNREQHKSRREKPADLLQVLNAFAELMAGLTCYLSCSHWTLGNRYAVVCVDSWMFLSKVYSSLQKGTSPQILCHYSLAVFSDPSAKTYSIKHLNIYLEGLLHKNTVLWEKEKRIAKQYMREKKGMISSAPWPIRVRVLTLSAFPACWTHRDEKGFEFP